MHFKFARYKKINCVKVHAATTTATTTSTTSTTMHNNYSHFLVVLAYLFYRIIPLSLQTTYSQADILKAIEKGIRQVSKSVVKRKIPHLHKSPTVDKESNNVQSTMFVAGRRDFLLTRKFLMSVVKTF